MDSCSEAGNRLDDIAETAAGKVEADAMEQFVDSPPPLTEIVRNILLTAWDPIRIQELPEKYRLAAADEYDDYIATIVKMINERSEQRAFE